MAMARFQHLNQLLLVGILLLPACRQRADDTNKGAQSQQQSEVKQPSASPEVFKYSLEELSQIGGYLPVLDEGRLQVAPPVDWHMASRSKDYVARFLFDQNRRLALPRITVEVAEAEATDPRNLTKENLVAHVEALTSRIDDKLRQAVQESMRPMMLGDVPCVRYVVPKAFRQGDRTLRGEREVLQTIRDGRVYTVSLDVNASMLLEFRADVYAVVATMKFPLAPEPDAPEPDAEGSTEDDTTDAQDSAEGKDATEQKDPAAESSQDGGESAS